jgi:hypothetical protein
MASWVTGDKLSPEDQQRAMGRFVHRRLNSWYTDDARWLRCTRFAVRKDGRLANNVHHCETNYPETQPCRAR